MKKLKLFLLMTMVTLTLCACGGEAAQSSPEDSKANSEVSQEDEKDDKNDKSSVKESSFECLPEMKDAVLEDCLVQIGNSIFRLDGTMSLKETMDALSACGLDVTVDEAGGKEINLETGLIQGRDYLYINAYVDNTLYYSMTFQNSSEETVAMGDDAVDLKLLWAGDKKALEYMYFCEGIPGDGEGLTYTSIKETYTELEETDQGLSRKVSIEKEDGQMRVIDLLFIIDFSDGSCTGVVLNVYGL
ncbi:MAG: hypothetical protein IJ324_05845 [Lachnospiraceae bacterium]|nr:hypothetical protein [Lachnospiraceae bacterium]